MTIRCSRHLLALALVALAAGCGGPLVNAKGKLTYKGQPVPSTYVMFQPEEEGKRASAGLTEDDGTFTLEYSRQEKGVLRGKHKVWLRYYVGVDEELGKIPPKASPELKRVIEKYGNVDKTPLSYEITKNGQFIEIDLK
jgi:hypothetical protein